MSQDQVYKFLKKNRNKWFYTKELVEKLKVKCVSRNLCVLHKSNEVHRKVGHNKLGNFSYMWKFKK